MIEFTPEEKEKLIGMVRQSTVKIANGLAQGKATCQRCGDDCKVDQKGREWAIECPSCGWSAVGMGMIKSAMQ